MSDIVLSASVRQNLLSLQSTANLLATTQNRLATGLKVNSALDNPTNYFTAQSLDNRAGDINNLLDSIGNGVQVLQAANTGITSLQQLVDTAKSIANQALQATSGYSTKSQFVSAAITGATASNLLGSAAATPAAAGTITAGAFTAVNVSGTGTAATSGSTTAASVYAGDEFVGDGTNNDSITVDGTTVTFDGTTNGTTAIADTTTHKYTIQEAVDKINHDLGAASSTVTAAVGTGADAGKIVFTNSATGTASNFTVDASGTTSGKTGGIGGTAVTTTNGAAAGAADSLSFDVTVDGGSPTTVNISKSVVDAYNTAHSTTLDSSALSATDVATLINDQVGSTVASVTAGALVFSSATGSTHSIQVGAVTAAGAATNTTGIAAHAAVSGTDAVSNSPLSGFELKIGATAGGTATDITFGTGAGQVSTLDQLNTALATNNLEASIDSTGKITITTTNDYASSTIGAISGTALTGTGAAFAAATVAAPVADTDAQNARASLVAQYNTVIDQIKTTAQDASFNGVNLLNGDQLKLVFNETGKSTLTIAGVTDDPAGLGLSSLTAGTDFLDNSSTNKILTSLNDASTTLRSQASTLGSNLSIVQIRQDFNKNLINVLQTGSSNLTLADTNEEAANSQALSTRQSIAVSALSLANQSQQSVLQLLR